MSKTVRKGKEKKKNCKNLVAVTKLKDVVAQISLTNDLFSIQFLFHVFVFVFVFCFFLSKDFFFLLERHYHLYCCLANIWTRQQ